MLQLSPEQISNYVGSVAGVLAVCLCFTPVVQFYSLFTGKEKYTIIPEAMLIFNILGRGGWSCYFFRQGLLVPLTSSLTGTVLGVIFASIYLYFYAEKNIRKFLLYIFVQYNLQFTLFIVCVYIIPSENILGKCLTVLQVIMYVAPGQNLIKVIRTGNHKLIPIAVTFVGFLCSIGWAIFGILRNDYNIVIPNGMGFIFALINTIVWFWAYCRSGKNEEKKDEKNENEELKKRKLLNNGNKDV